MESSIYFYYISKTNDLHPYNFRFIKELRAGLREVAVHKGSKGLGHSFSSTFSNNAEIVSVLEEIRTLFQHFLVVRSISNSINKGCLITETPL